ncbi:hypothetical protein [Hoylesella nanceiensis]|uniref:hypothetical protein n=1 Tax=Hoylesella nanceiensis TaxID=425941 RepID=UPI0028EEA8A6|nr:hypothetical protein [Hoylesella nanceiensis]
MQKHSHCSVMIQRLCWSLIASVFFCIEIGWQERGIKERLADKEKRLYSLKAVKSFTYWYLRDSDM